MADVVQRDELATFLRSRREATDPKALGLQPGPRRRTPGLRREELAQLSGVSVTWYTWLEQGRDIGPPERNFPLPVVIAHGVFAAVTIALVLLTVLGLGGS